VTRTPWYGFDLDGTLARYDGWVSPDHIGEPVDAMINKAKSIIEQGYEIRIFTARVSVPEQKDAATKAIQDWCESHGIGRPKVVCCKDYQMVTCFDDRAEQVIPNTGQTVWEYVQDLQKQLVNLQARLDQSSRTQRRNAQKRAQKKLDKTKKGK